MLTGMWEDKHKLLDNGGVPSYKHVTTFFDVIKVSKQERRRKKEREREKQTEKERERWRGRT